MTRLGQTAKEDDSLRAGEMHIVRQFLTQQTTGIIEDLFGYEITLLRCIEHIFGGDMVDVCHLAQECRLCR